MKRWKLECYDSSGQLLKTSGKIHSSFLTETCVSFGVVCSATPACAQLYPYFYLINGCGLTTLKKKKNMCLTKETYRTGNLKAK